MRSTDIYKITNLTNQKFYIGQSLDIPTRWKSHTNSISDESRESLIRKAFAKYGLREQVSSPGTYGNFKFEILEECTSGVVLEREAFYIKKLQPMYNIIGMGPSPDFETRENSKTKHFVQYHSVEKMGSYPDYEESGNQGSETLNHGIFTKKRLAINTLGSSIVLIVGAKSSPTSKTRYFLWSEFVVEDITVDHNDDVYIVEGIGDLLKQPVELTDLSGFSDFRKRNGNFAYGLQGMDNNPFFMQTIEKLVMDNTIPSNISYRDWIEKFLASSGLTKEAPAKSAKRKSTVPAQLEVPTLASLISRKMDQERDIYRR